MTLLAFEPESGVLTKIADYPFDGGLPEGGSFDLTGEHFLAHARQRTTRWLAGIGPSSKIRARKALYTGLSLGGIPREGRTFGSACLE